MNALTRLLALAVLLVACLPTPSRSMDVKTMRVPGASITHVFLSGEFKTGDANKFREAVKLLDRVTVVLKGEGGLLSEALDIGAEIHQRGFATMVLTDTSCYSACGLVWVAGVRRYMSQKSTLGFHAAYRTIDGQARESGAGNADVGSYLTHLGFRREAIRFMTIAGPAQFAQLTPETARAIGIEVYEVDDQGAIRDPRSAPTLDTLTYRFVASATLHGTCSPYFKVTKIKSDEVAVSAFKEGHLIATPEQWTDLMLLQLRAMKERKAKAGEITLCVELEAKMRHQGIAFVDGPSFACGSAKSKTEQAVCALPSVWAPDKTIAALYRYVLSTGSEETRRKLRSVQTNWMRYRDKCGDDLKCIERVYNDRIEDLAELTIQ